MWRRGGHGISWVTRSKWELRRLRTPWVRCCKAPRDRTHPGEVADHGILWVSAPIYWVRIIQRGGWLIPARNMRLDQFRQRHYRHTAIRKRCQFHCNNELARLCWTWRLCCRNRDLIGSGDLWYPCKFRCPDATLQWNRSGSGEWYWWRRAAWLPDSECQPEFRNFGRIPVERTAGRWNWQLPLGRDHHRGNRRRSDGSDRFRRHKHLEKQNQWHI